MRFWLPTVGSCMIVLGESRNNNQTCLRILFRLGFTMGLCDETFYLFFGGTFHVTKHSTCFWGVLFMQLLQLYFETYTCTDFCYSSFSSIASAGLLLCCLIIVSLAMKRTCLLWLLAILRARLAKSQYQLLLGSISMQQSTNFDSKFNTC